MSADDILRDPRKNPNPVLECEQCGDLCADGVRACPFSGLMLCTECASDAALLASRERDK